MQPQMALMVGSGSVPPLIENLNEYLNSDNIEKYNLLGSTREEFEQLFTAYNNLL